jgi:hypothetical protein
MLVNFPHAEELFSDLLMKRGFKNANVTEDEWNVISYDPDFVFRKNGVPAPTPSKEKALPGEPKDGEFRIMDVEKGVERTIRVDRQSKERDGRRRNDNGDKCSPSRFPTVTP